MHKLFLVSISLLTPAAEALAQETFYCRSPAELYQQVTDCDLNEHYAEAAVVCLRTLEKDIHAARRDLSAGMSSRNARAKAAQGGTLGAAQGNYGAAGSTLSSLISRTEATIREVARYQEELALPEDADAPEVLGQSVDEYLDSEPCFRDSFETLDFVLEDLNHHLEDLQAANAAASTHETVSGTRKTNIQGAGQPAVKGGAGQGGAKVRNKRSRDSDISGTRDSR
jgi:hypothetical protein